MTTVRVTSIFAFLAVTKAIQEEDGGLLQVASSSLKPLLKGCSDMADACGMRGWDQGIPPEFSDWGVLKDSLELCCSAGNHKNFTCAGVVDEIFEGMSSRQFPDGLDGSFCTEIQSALVFHWAWDGQRQRNANRRSALVETLTNRITELQHSSPAIYEHFLMKGLGVIGTVALAQLSGALSTGAVVAAIGSAVATHLNGCDMTKFNEAIARLDANGGSANVNAKTEEELSERYHHGDLSDDDGTYVFDPLDQS